MSTALSTALGPAQPVATTDVISTTQVDTARSHAAARGIPVVVALEDLLAAAPDDLTRSLGATLHYCTATMRDLHRWQPRFDVLPLPEASRAQMLVMADDAGALRLVFGDPFNSARLAWAERRVQPLFTWTLAHTADVAACLARHEEGLSAMDGLLAQNNADARPASGVEDLSFRSITEDASPVVKLVRSTLHDALKAGASDVHFECSATGLVVKYRVDGVLMAVAQVPGTELAEQLVSRIKVMAELDIAERRVPQDGRFKASTRGRDIDFRVSIMPSIRGEDAVLRILDKQRLADEVRGLTLDSLGFDAPSRALIRRFAAQPHGMLLATGPTGSGKTTTLYAAISESSRGSDKIITIEDPVEYELPGVLQIPVNERKGLGFARGLRSILRHDPDRVMVGEIRDPETAQIAVQAALTGHLVFTTVHANNVFDVLGRFTHMGVDPYSFAAALNGIVAQRLLRLNCSHCEADMTPDPQLLESCDLQPNALAGWTFKQGLGCGQCRSTGYKGRTAIAEVLVLTDELREMIVSRQPIRAVKEAARRGGTVFLRDSALALVRAGRTSLEEVTRVTAMG